MPRIAQDQFDDDDEDDADDAALSDRDDPDPSDQDDDDGDEYDETLPCPYCGKAMDEQAEVCPHCRNFISREDAPHRRLKWWVWLAVVLCLVALLLTAIWPPTSLT